MGLFLNMFGVIGAGPDDAARALRSFCKEIGISVTEAPASYADENAVAVLESTGGSTILFPGDFFDWEAAALHMSRTLKKPVFSFHIHDGDFWMYSFQENGEIVDQFNPTPDYWGDVDDEARKALAGNAAAVAGRIPGLNAQAIERYLVPWGLDVLESEEASKAYPTDEYHYGQDWQLLDFMKKLGLEYPVDKRGELRGVTYRLDRD